MISKTAKKLTRFFKNRKTRLKKAQIKEVLIDVRDNYLDTHPYKDVFICNAIYDSKYSDVRKKRATEYLESKMPNDKQYTEYTEHEFWNKDCNWIGAWWKISAALKKNRLKELMAIKREYLAEIINDI